MCGGPRHLGSHPAHALPSPRRALRSHFPSLSRLLRGSPAPLGHRCSRSQLRACVHACRRAHEHMHAIICRRYEMGPSSAAIWTAPTCTRALSSSGSSPQHMSTHEWRCLRGGDHGMCHVRPCLFIPDANACLPGPVPSARRLTPYPLL